MELKEEPHKWNDTDKTQKINPNTFQVMVEMHCHLNFPDSHGIFYLGYYAYLTCKVLFFNPNTALKLKRVSQSRSQFSNQSKDHNIPQQLWSI